jgi:hypothetical protein
VDALQSSIIKLSIMISSIGIGFALLIVCFGVNRLFILLFSKLFIVTHLCFLIQIVRIYQTPDRMDVLSIMKIATTKFRCKQVMLTFEIELCIFS